jgi:hypothetical protein
LYGQKNPAVRSQGERRKWGEIVFQKNLEKLQAPEEKFSEELLELGGVTTEK